MERAAGSSEHVGGLCREVLGVRAERPTDGEGEVAKANERPPGRDWTRNGKPTLDAAQGPSQPHGAPRLGNRLHDHFDFQNLCRDAHLAADATTPGPHGSGVSCFSAQNSWRPPR